MIQGLQSAVRRQEKLASLSDSLREERAGLLSLVQKDGPRLDEMRQKMRERAAWRGASNRAGVLPSTRIQVSAEGAVYRY